MVKLKPVKITLISIASAVVGFVFSLVAYVCMVEAIKITSVVGYNESIIPYCVVSIVVSSLSFVVLMFAVIVIVKALDRYLEYKKNGTKYRLCVLLIVLCFVVILSALLFSFSAMFGSVGLIG